MKKYLPMMAILFSVFFVGCSSSKVEKAKKDYRNAVQLYTQEYQKIKTNYPDDIAKIPADKKADFDNDFNMLKSALSLQNFSRETLVKLNVPKDEIMRLWQEGRQAGMSGYVHPSSLISQ